MFPNRMFCQFPFLSQKFEVRPRLTEAGGLTASVPWMPWLAAGPFLDRLPGLVNIQKTSKNYGKSPCSMRKSTISMVIFNSYVKLPEGIGSVMLIHLNTSYIIFFIITLIIIVIINDRPILIIGVIYHIV
jgi:hypothetical protein